jgi:hypothetical protein
MNTLYTTDPILICLLQSEDYYKPENTAVDEAQYLLSMNFNA